MYFLARFLTGKIFQNNFFNRVLTPGTYLDRFLFQNAANSTNQISISIFLDQIRARFHLNDDFPTLENCHFFSNQVFLKKNNLFSTSIIILHHLSLYDSYNLKISPIFHSQGTLVFHKSFKSRSNFVFRKNIISSTSIIIPSIFP